MKLEERERHKHGAERTSHIRVFSSLYVVMGIWTKAGQLLVDCVTPSDMTF